MPDANAVAQKLMDDAMDCFNRGDVKGLVALYAPDAIDVGPDGAVAIGAAAIERNTADMMDGPFKGAKGTATVDNARFLGSDVLLLQGMFNITAPGQPEQRLPYLGAARRVQGTWLFEAAMAMIPAGPPS